MGLRNDLGEGDNSQNKHGAGSRPKSESFAHNYIRRDPGKDRLQYKYRRDVRGGQHRLCPALDRESDGCAQNRENSGCDEQPGSPRDMRMLDERQAEGDD